MSFQKHKEDWEYLGRLDPLWAIFVRPEKQFGKWDIEQFFLTGARDVEDIMQSAIKLGYPSGRETALDFGCGVGRLTRALASYFEQCYGVDISDNMITKARELNASIGNCKFIVNNRADLRIFPDRYFDIIYSKWVLQHLPAESMITSYIAEFVRTLKKDGLLVFQLRTHLPLLVRLQPRRRLYAVLKKLRFSDRFLYERLALHPMKMTSIPEKTVGALLDRICVKVLNVETYSVPSGQGSIYWVTKS